MPWSLALVKTLFFRCGPTTIAGLIVPVVIDAVDAMFGRGAVAHISQEVLEGVTPALADRNPAATVPRPVFTLRVCAAIDHMSPRSIFRGTPLSSACMTMLQTCLCRPFSLQTAAALRMSGLEVVSGCNCFSAAITSTSPDGLFFPIGAPSRESLYDSQTTEPQGHQVKGFHGASISRMWPTLGRAGLGSMAAGGRRTGGAAMSDVLAARPGAPW